MKVTCHDIFHSFLCFATIALIVRCIHLYFIDEDATQVEFFKFYDPKSYFYPSISLCFTTIFTDSNNFDIYFTNKTDEELSSIQDNYFLILKNGTFLENPNQSRDLGSDLQRYLNIDYDKVTKDIENYFLNSAEKRLQFVAGNDHIFVIYKFFEIVKRFLSHTEWCFYVRKIGGILTSNGFYCKIIDRFIVIFVNTSICSFAASF